MNLVDRYYEIKSKIPIGVKLVVVSKTKPAEMLKLLSQQTGHLHFGENRVIELEAKQAILSKDICWHFIGHLQTNKIKHIAPFVGMIQSVDSFRLLIEINKEAKKNKRVISCLLQFHIASEETKFGFLFDEACLMLDNSLFQELKNVKICGVMGMATYTKDKQQIRKEFKTLFEVYSMLKTRYFALDPAFCEISMGMTDDYTLAIEEGSTIVRVGTGIFGER